MVPGRATSGGRTGSYDCSYAGTMCLCSLRCDDAVCVLSARECFLSDFLSEMDPVPVLDGGDGDVKVESGKLSSTPVSVGRPRSSVLVAVEYRDGMACISVVGSGGAERVITSGILDASHGGSFFAPMYPGVDAVLEAESSRFIASTVSSPDIREMGPTTFRRSSCPKRCNNQDVLLLARQDKL
jgi:hypothetical protein